MPFFFFFLLDDSSFRSALGFFCLVVATGCSRCRAGLDVVDLTGSFSRLFRGGRYGVDRADRLEDGARAFGAFTTWTPTPVPPAGFSNCKGAWEG